MKKRKNQDHSSHRRGKEGCESQLESDKARNPGANRNPRTESIEDWREQEIYWKASCFSFCVQCNSIPDWILSTSGRAEGKSEFTAVSPTWAPMSRSQELRKDTERKHSRSPGWLRLVGSGCTDQHGSPRQGERKTKTAGSQLPAAESKLPSGRFNELHNQFLSRRQWKQEYTLNVLEVELPEFPNLTLLFASRWLWGSYLTVVCHTHEIHKTDYCDGLNKQSD